MVSFWNSSPKSHRRVFLPSSVPGSSPICVLFLQNVPMSGASLVSRCWEEMHPLSSQVSIIPFTIARSISQISVVDSAMFRSSTRRFLIQVTLYSSYSSCSILTISSHGKSWAGPPWCLAQASSHHGSDHASTPKKRPYIVDGAPTQTVSPNLLDGNNERHEADVCVV